MHQNTPKQITWCLHSSRGSCRKILFCWQKGLCLRSHVQDPTNQVCNNTENEAEYKTYIEAYYEETFSVIICRKDFYNCFVVNITKLIKYIGATKCATQCLHCLKLFSTFVAPLHTYWFKRGIQYCCNRHCSTTWLFDVIIITMMYEPLNYRLNPCTG